MRIIFYNTLQKLETTLKKQTIYLEPGHFELKDQHLKLIELEVQFA